MGKIRVYTNESVDVAIADGLRRRGVDAFSARDRGNLGFTDEEQLAFAGNEKAIIFTHDTDFLMIGPRCMEQMKDHHGIIYCHQKTYSVGQCIRRLRALTSVLTSEDMINHIEFL